MYANQLMVHEMHPASSTILFEFPVVVVHFMHLLLPCRIVKLAWILQIKDLIFKLK